MTTLDLICNAAFPTQTIAYKNTRQGIGGAVVKAVLLTLWRHQGEPVSCRAVSELSGCSETAAFRAILALQSLKIVKAITPFRCRAKSYHVDVVKLARFQVTATGEMKRWDGRHSIRNRKAPSTRFTEDERHTRLCEALAATGVSGHVFAKSLQRTSTRKPAHIEGRRAVYQWLRNQGLSFTEVAEITLGKPTSHSTVQGVLKGVSRPAARPRVTDASWASGADYALARAGAVGKGTA